MILEKIFIYIDGGSRGNPGSGAIGILITNKRGQISYTHGGYSGKVTTNQAEYTGLLKALKNVSGHFHGEVSCFSDSELMIRQLNEKYKVKNPDIRKLFLEVKELEKEFEKISYTHVYRENKNIIIVDRLVNKTLDEISKC